MTGCSSGLGKALCERLLRKNRTSAKAAYRIFATARDVDSLADLRANGVKTLQLDVRDEASVKECVGVVLREAGRIDVLIANAGVAAVMPLLEQPIEQMQKVLDTNVLGVLRVIQVIQVYHIP